jgi:PadR family transcriptional regulator
MADEDPPQLRRHRRRFPLDCVHPPGMLYYHSMISADDNMVPPLLRHFFLGFIKIHVLHHAAQEPVFGLALIRELARHGYALSPGTLYPILHELERAGYLECDVRVVHGKVRKYYRATPLGEQALAEARTKIRELVTEVLRAEGPRSLANDEDLQG